METNITSKTTSKLKQLRQRLFSETMFWALLLSVVVIVSRVVLLALTSGPMYYYDSYYYFSYAKDFISKGQIPSADPAFGILLGLWIAPFGSISDLLLVARFFTITLTLITALLLFNLNRKFMNNEFAFLAAALIMMEPLLLSFSITTHNDVFGLMTAVLSLNFAFSRRKILYILGAPATFALTVISKPFLYIVLAIPLILIYAHRILRSSRSRKFKAFVLLGGLAIYSLVPFTPIAQEYYYRQTRFDPLTKAQIFLRPDIINFVTNEIFSFAELNFIDISILALFVVGNILILYPLVKRFRQNGNTANPGRTQVLSLLMILMVYLSIFAFPIFVMPYQITSVTGRVIPVLNMNQRYLIWPRFAVLWVVAFALWYIFSIAIRHQEVKT